MLTGVLADVLAVLTGMLADVLTVLADVLTVLADMLAVLTDVFTHEKKMNWDNDHKPNIRSRQFVPCVERVHD